MLEITAYAENYSNHPIANSIKTAYNKPINANLIENIEEISGNGIKATVNGAEILVGNNKLMKNFAIEIPTVTDFGSIVYIAENRVYSGYIIISDEIKPDSKVAVTKLKQLVKKIVMLSGDNKQTAEKVASLLGIDLVQAELLPAQKVENLENLINEHKGNVIFVGDGINDAPVLTRADAGIAMGALGSDSAIESADIVIMDDKPSKIVNAILISKKTMAIVRENIIFALGIKILFLVLGAFGFVTMWGAVFADVGVTLIAILNSLRALKV